jgi:hypothetical protein
MTAASVAAGIGRSALKGVGEARPVWGVELVVDGGLTDSANWTDNANFPVANNVATKIPGALGLLDQAIAFVAGAKYRTQFTLVSRVAGSVTPQLTGGSTVGGTARTSPAIYVQPLVAVTGNNNLRFTSASAGDLVIDNISVRRIA